MKKLLFTLLAAVCIMCTSAYAASDADVHYTFDETSAQVAENGTVTYKDGRFTVTGTINGSDVAAMPKLP